MKNTATALLEPETFERSQIKIVKSQKIKSRYKNMKPGSLAEAAMVEEHLSLVKTVVGRLAMSLPPHVDPEDLYSSGLVGLLNAVRQFDPLAGSSFESYAKVRIRGAIFDELRRLDWIPRSVHEKARKVQGAMEQLEQKLGRIPTDSEMCKALELSPSEYEELQAQIRPATFVCLDSLVGGEDENETSRHEWVADMAHGGPDEGVAQKELTAVIAERIEQLPEMQRKVLALYYFEDMRLREIAEAFGVTESRICQIHSQAILAIRAFLEKNKSKIS
ncbi:MAG: sigma-70 family RNA polymerase sigma factor [Verrucomicrobiota bacterium]|jgi:RNA polymerase sigma factor for flagellar operon FliA